MIWMLEKNKLSKCKLIITNQIKFDELLEKIDNVSLYSNLDYSASGIKYYSFTEPMRRLLSNIKEDKTTNIKNDFEFSCFFVPKYHVPYGKDIRTAQIEELECVSSMIKLLENSSLDNKTIKTIIEEMFPVFGYYATSSLQCIGIDICEEYDLVDYRKVEVACKAVNASIPKEVGEILNDRRISIAQNNTKVLSLVKKISRMCN